MLQLFDEAVDDLRKSARQDHLPRGLIARATLSRETGHYSSARRDLQEALAIARRGGMALHETDAHLEYARLCLADGNRAAARQHLETARAAVARLGYRRRDPEVAELARQLG